MLVVNYNEHLGVWETYSDKQVMIRRIHDRAGLPLDPAETIIGIDDDIDGNPRFDYEETEHSIENDE